MIKVDDLIEWAKLNAYGRRATIYHGCAYGRSTTIYHGWIRAEDLQSLVYKIVEADPMEYEPFNKGGDDECKR